MDSFQVNQVFYVFGWSQRPADVATDPVKCQGLISTELTGELKEKQDSNQCNRAAGTWQHAKLNRHTDGGNYVETVAFT